MKRKRTILLFLVISITLLYSASCADPYDKSFEENVINALSSANVLILRKTASESSVTFSAGASGTVFAKENFKYYVLTAYHAIESAVKNSDEIIVLTHTQKTYRQAMKDGEETYGIVNYYDRFAKGKVEFYDANYDLAVISFEIEMNLTCVAISKQNTKQGDKVATLSNPYNKDRNSVTIGKILSEFPEEFGDEEGKTQHKVIEHSAKIFEGCSGSMLIDQNLQLIGINLGASVNGLGKFVSGKAMPCDKINEFLKQTKLL